MAAVSTAASNEVTLKGSVETVTEFFGFAINSILYQRGIYPPDSFSTAMKYGLPMQVSTDEGLKAYLSQVLKQISAWLTYGQVQKFVVAVSGVESGETLERWVFNVQTDADVVAKGASGASASGKDPKEVQKEIQAIIRQITASVTFLPMLEEPCAFDLLVYTDKDAAVPTTWEDSDPRYIQKASEVMLRSFTTTVHKVDAAVAYKNPDEDI